MRDKEKKRAYDKEYRIKNKDKIKDYYKNNKNKSNIYSKEYYRNNKDKVRALGRSLYEKYTQDWKDYLIRIYGASPTCRICGKILGWFTRDRMLAPHFDHRNGGQEIIKGNPSNWLLSHACTLVNIQVFESCNFGLLCHDCNQRLPTQNRTDWLVKATEYDQETNGAGI